MKPSAPGRKQNGAYLRDGRGFNAIDLGFVCLAMYNCQSNCKFKAKQHTRISGFCFRE